MGKIFSSNISGSKFLPLCLLAFVIAICHGSQHSLLSVQHQQCISEHFSALLDLKTGLSFSYYIGKDLYHSKSNLSSWNPENRKCCTWEGIACDRATGHVTSLHLNELSLSGEINFKSICRIQSLQILNLAYNHFFPSPIPSVIGRLMSLTHLNLSHTQVYDKIPLEMLSLTRLVSLDLSGNGCSDDGSNFIPLKWKSIGAVIQNMSSLRELYLDYVDMSAEGSQWSQILSSAPPSLRKLSMYNCSLSGTILPSISQLHFLSHVNLGNNNFSSMSLDSFGNLLQEKPLTNLTLHNCSISGSIPPWFSNFTKLEHLDLYENNLRGIIPPSFFTLPSLRFLKLRSNQLEGQLSESEFHNFSTSLAKLESLDLSLNNFSGILPSSLFALPSLRFLFLRGNKLGGRLSEFLNSSSSLEKMEYLDLARNQLVGCIPSWLFALPSLQTLNIRGNQLSGQLFEFRNSSSALKKLENLDLSVNKLTGSIPSSVFELPSLRNLKLWGNQFSGQLNEFPNSSSSLLDFVDLAYNQLQGMIPMSITQLEKLNFLTLDTNYFTSVPDLNLFTNFTNLSYIDLCSNKLEGSLPIPPPSANVFLFCYNYLSGEIPMSICNASSLQAFDIRSNNFSGHVPRCFGEMSSNLTILDLTDNHLTGNFFQTFKEDCSLERLNLGVNELEGKLPGSLGNCKKLTSLNLGYNQLQDTFPLWVQGLAYLRIFILRSNNFYGPIQHLTACSNLSSLQIVDLSFNKFNGSLPSTLFCGWKKMTGEGSSEPKYIKTFAKGYGYIYDSGILRIKGLEMYAWMISTATTVLDLSGNLFEGPIPESIGALKSLWGLNMSHNGFTGQIPSSFRNTTMLESLDLSQNKLSGSIPHELLELTFLSKLDLSENQLTGSIPQGKQFSTFTNESFDGNPGLCGPPLSKMCGDSHVAPSPTSNDEELISESEFDWKITAIGFGIGYGVGLGAFCWVLVLWAKGRRAYNKFVHKMLLLAFP